MTIAIILALGLLAIFGTITTSDKIGYNIDPSKLTIASATPDVPHVLGTRIQELENTKEYQWVIAGGSITAGDLVKIKYGDTNAPFCVVQTAAATDQVFGVACATATSGQYFWVQIYGKYTAANVATAITAGAMVSASSTAGRGAAYANTDTTMSKILALTAGSSNTADVFINRL